MNDLNTITITGVLGNAPKLISEGEKYKLHSINICVRRAWKKKEETEWSEESFWVSVNTFFDISKYDLQKGDRILVIGRLSVKEKFKEGGGMDRYVNVVANTLRKLKKKEKQQKAEAIPEAIPEQEEMYETF